MRRRSVEKWILAAVLVVVFAALPFALVAACPGVDADAFTGEVEVDSRLAETLGGKLEFLLVRGIDGRLPAERLVITIDHGYTAGVEEDTRSVEGSVLAPGQTFWLQGSLMDRDLYFGEQYLFFGYPQLYVSQARSGLLWPSQVQRLQTLYLSPFTALGSLYLVWAYPFMEEYSLVSWLLMIARLILLCAAVAIVVFRRKGATHRATRLIAVVGLYALLAIALAIPEL